MDKLNEKRKLNVGDKVYIPDHERPFKVICRDERFIICTKPFNARKTVIYFIIDLVRDVRGPDNLIFCPGYDTDEQCLQRLKELQEGRIEVSKRRGIPLDLGVC